MIPFIWTGKGVRDLDVPGHNISHPKDSDWEELSAQHSPIIWKGIV